MHGANENIIPQTQFLAHLAEGTAYDMAQRPSSVVRPASTSSFKRLFLKNHRANFNQTWKETFFADGDSDLFKLRGWTLQEPFKGQKR